MRTNQPSPVRTGRGSDGGWADHRLLPSRRGTTSVGLIKLTAVANVCLVAPLRLLPDEKQEGQLRRTVRRANEARSWVARQGHENHVVGRVPLHRLVYYETRSRFGLSAQMTVRVIGSVVECFRRDPRRVPKFRPGAAFPYDERILRLNREQGTVSIWTLEGRQTIPYAIGQRQRALLDEAIRIGESDLKPLPDGRWMLYVSVRTEVPDTYEPKGWLGVDLGVVNIAADSDGQRVAGKRTNGLRRRRRLVRERLQRKGTRSARRRLRRYSGRERRFMTDVSHQIAKELVRRAERTGRGIALEELSGIRGRIRASRQQRGVLHSWSFRQLQEFISYKARRAGVPVLFVDPRSSSRECPRCGYCNRRNRLSRDRFRCVRCTHTGCADVIAACNIARRADVSRPNVPSHARRTSRGLPAAADNGEVSGQRGTLDALASSPMR